MISLLVYEFLRELLFSMRVVQFLWKIRFGSSIGISKKLPIKRSDWMKFLFP